MSTPLALTLALLLQAPTAHSGVVVSGYPGTLALRVSPGEPTPSDVLRFRLVPGVTRAYIWDGTRIYAEELRPGDRVRVVVDGEFLSPYHAGDAVRVVLGPPPDGPDFAFAAIVEAWVAGTDKETRALVRNLGSRSWPVRERATRELRGLGRAAAAGALLWGRENVRDAEARDRVRGLTRAMWMEVGR